MNQLEAHILKGAIKAQKLYREMTDGWWLWHGPESYLQTIVAQELSKSGHNIYMDTSIKKILKEVKRGPGRPATYERQRPDISVWHKDDLETLRAAIEVKRAMNFDTIRQDAKKIERYLSHKKAAKTGYVLCYSEATRRHADLLGSRFQRWVKTLGPKWSLACNHIDPSKDDANRVWGVALLRYDRH